MHIILSILCHPFPLKLGVEIKEGSILNAINLLFVLREILCFVLRVETYTRLKQLEYCILKTDMAL